MSSRSAPRTAFNVTVVAAVAFTSLFLRFFLSNLAVVPAVAGIHPMQKLLYWSVYVLVVFGFPGAVMWSVRRVAGTDYLWRNIVTMYIVGLLYFYLSEIVVYGPFLLAGEDLLAYALWSLPLAIALGSIRRRQPST